MKIIIPFLGLLLLAGCTTQHPPTITARGVEKSSAQTPTSATAPEELFFGAATPLKKIVFVVDHSASMTDTIPFVKKELKRSIRSLRPNSQAFWITFFSSGPSIDLPTATNSGTLPATMTNKDAAYDFIDGIVAEGRTDPAEAIRKAFDRQPNLIYILTDGEFAPAMADLIAKLNPKKEVTVNTICLVYPNGEKILKKIAEENNGSYKFISEDELVNLKR